MFTSRSLSQSRRQDPRTVIGLVTLIAFAGSLPGCTALRYRPVALKEMEVDRDGLVKRRLRLTAADGRTVTWQIKRVDYPFVWGVTKAGTGLTQVALDEIVSLAQVFAVAGPYASNDVTYPGPFGPFSTERMNNVLRSQRMAALRTAKGEVWIAITRVLDGFVEGRPLRGRPGRVDLRQAVKVEMGENDIEMSVVKSLGLVAGVFLASIVIVALTKESCPFVYVDRGAGPELVGEAYPGAAFRSVQRDDVLALGPVPAGDVRVRLRNEARETQFTDRAELVVVDHSEGLEAVATHDAKVVVLERSMPPLSATVDGEDVTPSLREADDRSWERDVTRAAVAAPRPTDDSVVVDLPVPANARPGERQTVAIDLKVGNTPLVDLVFGRFFAAMGSDLKKFVSDGNGQESGARIRNWLTREGVNLTVEVNDGSGFRLLAAIPPTGPARTRRIALPVDIPANARSLQVRLRGGVGFWRYDAVRAASVAGPAPRMLVVGAKAAVSSREAPSRV